MGTDHKASEEIGFPRKLRAVPILQPSWESPGEQIAFSVDNLRRPASAATVPMLLLLLKIFPFLTGQVGFYPAPRLSISPSVSQ